MAGSYDANKDYAAAIKKETDPGKKQQLINERQNKIDAMNAAGTNKNGYTNSIYGGSSGNNSSGSNKNSGSSSSKGSGSSGSSGYFDANKDYAAAIKNAQSDAERNQLIAERENKLNWLNATGQNKGYSNDIYTGGSGSNNVSSSVSKDSYGYFDSGKDYAAAIAAETDPVKKAQLIQERQNKLDYLNATGQNQNGYTNSIYGGSNPSSFGNQEPAVKGIYQNQDAVINNTALGAEQMQTIMNAALANSQQGEAMQIDPVATIDYQQVLNNTTDPAQRAALQAYFTRMQSNTDPSEVAGVYAGDTSMSLPDQALMKQYQQMYNDAKAAGNTTLMNAAHKAAENLRDNYRYYPLANSSGYNLGENDLGWIRDIVVRVDGLGNKYVDEYGLNNVTTTRFNADGSQSWKNVSKIGAHDDYVARQWERAEEYGKPENWTAIRIADANDVNLSAADLMAKYGAQAGMGRDLYGNARINSKVANGKTLADVYAEQGIISTGAVNNAAQAAVTGNYNGYGYFDPNLDYAALIAAETDPTRRAQLMQERENKINYLNGTGQNPNGYTNAIYGQTVQQTVPVVQQQMPMVEMPEYIGMTQEDIQAQYADMAAQLAAARQQQLNLTLQQSQAAQDAASAEYDDLARQAYILKRQQEMALPQQLSAMGISGGGSESANMQLQANYQNNLNNNEKARQRMMQDYALQNLAARTQANTDISGFYADANQSALNAWQNEQANKNAWNQWAANYQLSQQQYANDLAQQQYQNQFAQQQYQDELKQQQINLALQMGDYNKLKALGYDTTYLQRLQDAELNQLALEALYTQAQTAKVNGSVKSGSGGGKYTGGGNVTSEDEMEIGNGHGSSWISIPGIGRVAFNDSGNSELDQMVENGTVKETVRNGKIYYVKA